MACSLPFELPRAGASYGCAKYCSLTRAGGTQLTEETENWQRLSEAVARVLQTA